MSDDDFDLVRGSGNVFRDFGLPDPDLRQAKCILAAEILKTLDERQWSTRKAQQETGVNHADYTRIRSVKLDRFTIERLTSILGTLGREVEFTVNVRPRSETAAPSLQPGLA